MNTKPKAGVSKASGGTDLAGMQTTMIAIGSKSAHHLPTSAPAPKWAKATGKTHSPNDASGP